MSEVLLFLDNTKSYTSVCIVEAITRFRWTVMLHPPYISDCEDSITLVMMHHRMLSASGSSEGEQLLVGGCECSCSKVNKDSLQRLILH